MPKQSRKRSKREPARKAFDAAITFIGFGLVLFAVPLFPSSSQALATVGTAMRGAAPYALGVGSLMLALSFLLRAPNSRASSPPENRIRQPPATAWSPRVFQDIEWRRFEVLCAALFGQAGFETRAQSHGADGGVDIWLHSKNSQGPAAVVQCKHWIGKPVGVKELREFYGVMASHKLQRGTFATTSTFTADALKFAKDNGISALDGEGLLGVIATRTPAQQQELLATAYEGEYWRPTCASCGIKMVERERKKDGGLFWGCSNYPRCNTQLRMRST